MRRLPQVAVVGACLLAGCGSDVGQPGDEQTTTVPASRGIALTAREYSFQPSKLVVTGGGGKVRITLTNRGSLAHDVHVLQDGRDLGGTSSFQGGSRSAELTLKPGRYQFICTVGDHAKLGMRGSLTVEK